MSYICSECDKTYNQWAGQCTHCLAWNTFIDFQPQKTKKASKQKGYAGTQSEIKDIRDIEILDTIKVSSGSLEFDRVLGGGLVAGAVILIGGDPGIGKSTLLLQTMADLSINRQN